MGAHIHLNPDGSELIGYNNKDFPVLCGVGNISCFCDHAVTCHWHDDFEILIAVNGKMDYFVAGEVVTIEEGQGVFANSRRLHYNYSRDMTECVYKVLVFHPSIFGEHTIPIARYLESISGEARENYLSLRRSEPLGQEILELVDEIEVLFNRGDKFFELAVQGACGRILSAVGTRLTGDTHCDLKKNKDWAALREMLGFIQSHYGEKLRLTDISAAGAVCRSKCCRVFKELLNQTPNEYLTRYRLEKAGLRLAGTPDSITEIAMQCGFESASYFAETFRKIYGMTPREYRQSAART